MGYAAYLEPAVVGYSSGATLAYAALVEAAPHTFRGGLGLGFCPDFPDKHPLCPGQGLASLPNPRGKGIDFLPAPNLEAPFVALNGRTDRVCPRQDVRVYMRQLKRGKLILVPHLGHGFNALEKWTGRFRQVYRELVR